MKKGKILCLVALCLSCGVVSCGNSSNKKKDEQINLLKDVGNQIACLGKKGIPEEMQSSSASYKTMVVQSALFAYTQGVYLESNVYNHYNKIVRWQYDRGDGVNGDVGVYVNVDKNNNSIDIYNVAPDFVYDSDSNKTYYYDGCILLHVDYNFATSTLGDYFYAMNSPVSELNQDNQLINVTFSLDNITLFHQTSGKLYSASNDESVKGTPFASDNDPYFSTLKASYKEKMENFRNNLSSSKISADMAEPEGLSEKIADATTSLGNIYEVGQIIKFGVITRSDTAALLSDKEFPLDFNSVTTEIYQSDGSLLRVDTLNSKSWLQEEENYKEYYLTEFSDSYLAFEKYSVCYEDGALFIKVKISSNEYKYYDYNTFKLVKEVYDNSTHYYRYFYDDQYTYISQTQYDAAISLLNSTHQYQVSNYYDYGRDIGYTFMVENDNAYFDGPYDSQNVVDDDCVSYYYQGKAYVIDGGEKKEVTTSEAKVLKDALGSIYEKFNGNYASILGGNESNYCYFEYDVDYKFMGNSLGPSYLYRYDDNTINSFYYVVFDLNGDLKAIVVDSWTENNEYNYDYIIIPQDVLETDIKVNDPSESDYYEKYIDINSDGERYTLTKYSLEQFKKVVALTKREKEYSRIYVRDNGDDIVESAIREDNENKFVTLEDKYILTRDNFDTFLNTSENPASSWYIVKEENRYGTSYYVNPLESNSYYMFDEEMRATYIPYYSISWF